MINRILVYGQSIALGVDSSIAYAFKLRDNEILKNVIIEPNITVCPNAEILDRFSIKAIITSGIFSAQSLIQFQSGSPAGAPPIAPIIVQTGSGSTSKNINIPLFIIGANNDVNFTIHLSILPINSTVTVLNNIYFYIENL
jgi:hypothetical protein